MPAVRQIVMFNWVTADGFFAAPDLVCPVLLGRGRSLMDGISRSLKVDLVEAQKYESGDVLLRYTRTQ